jgi:hypothetical protein
MLYLDNHKGHSCVFKAILCQEGFCSNCAIYFEEKSSLKPLFVDDLRLVKRNKEINRNSKTRVGAV